MKRLFVGAGALVCAAVLLIVATAAVGAPPRAQLRAFACARALDPPNRSVSVTAVMRPVAGTRHLQLKFDLLTSHGAPTAQRVIRAGDLGVWITPRNATLGQLPGDVWNLQKSVVELAAPAVYRFKVDFRWLGDNGQVLGLAQRYSRRCFQRELRPDLLVQSITVTGAGPNQDLYKAVIANDGNSAAGPFDVLFAPADGSAAQTQTVPLLPAHSIRTETFIGPVCTAASDPTITVDSTLEVDDLNRANNGPIPACPASGGG